MAEASGIEALTFATEDVIDGPREERHHEEHEEHEDGIRRSTNRVIGCAIEVHRNLGRKGPREEKVSGAVLGPPIIMEKVNRVNAELREE